MRARLILLFSGFILLVFGLRLVAQVAFAPAVTYFAGDGAEGPIVAADVNNDGKLDLIRANVEGKTVTVLTNSGNGVFGFSGSYPAGNMPGSVVAADGLVLAVFLDELDAGAKPRFDHNQLDNQCWCRQRWHEQEPRLCAISRKFIFPFVSSIAAAKLNCSKRISEYSFGSTLI